MLTILTIGGGVALILFGVRFLFKGLDRLFGPRLGVWLRRMAGNRFSAFIAGLGVATVTPSSTTISLLAVQTVQAGHLTPRQTLALMLGANIGLTVMVQLIALNLDAYAPLLILVGVACFQFSREPRLRGIGQVTLSLGLVLMAIGIIKGAATAARTAPGSSGDLLAILEIIQRYPFWLAVITAGLTMMLQSSTSVIGLVIGLVPAHEHGLALAVPAVLGANVGLGMTTLVAGWRQADSRRMAAANAFLKILLAAILLPLTGWVTLQLERIADDPPTQIAHFYTLFNVGVAIIGLPFVGVITTVIERILPTPPDSESFGPRHLQFPPPESTALALGQSLREVLRVAEIVRAMFDDLWRAHREDDLLLARSVRERDDQVDLLDAEIKRFLSRVGPAEGEGPVGREPIAQLGYLTELETIGDSIDKNLSELVIKRLRLGVQFSPESTKEFAELFTLVRENMLIAEAAFVRRDKVLAHQLFRHRQYLDALTARLRDKHFARVNKAGTLPFPEHSAIYLDMLTQLNWINTCLSHVGVLVVQQDEAEAAPETVTPAPPGLATQSPD